MDAAFARIEQKNKFSVGETIEIMKPDGRNIAALVQRHLHERKARARRAHRIRNRSFISIWTGKWSSTIFSARKRRSKIRIRKEDKAEWLRAGFRKEA